MHIVIIYYQCSNLSSQVIRPKAKAQLRTNKHSVSTTCLLKHLHVYASAMVTSTSTPGSMLMEVICFTISDGLCRSIRRLWILIWKRSQVLDPSPQGVFLVVMRRVCDRAKKYWVNLTHGNTLMYWILLLCYHQHYLGGHADRSLHLQVLLLSTTDQVCAN